MYHKAVTRRALPALVAFMLAGCVMTKPLTTTRPFQPPPGQAGILVIPRTELGVLTAAGLVEPRKDWTENAAANVTRHMRALLGSAGHRVMTFDNNAELAPAQLQIVRLHEAVADTIIAVKHGFLALPTKKNTFDWSLGPGARALADPATADFALFVHASGTYASAGRVVTAAVMGALFGVAIDTGKQVAYASLVDLNTGDIVWFNVAAGGDTYDLRDPDDSRSFVKAILKDIPIAKEIG